MRTGAPAMITLSDGATRASSPRPTSTITSTATTGMASRTPSTNTTPSSSATEAATVPPMPPTPIGSAAYESASARMMAWCTFIARHSTTTTLAYSSASTLLRTPDCGSIKAPSERPIW